MNYEKTNPKGIDRAIQRLQGKVYSSLIKKWTTNALLFDGYGRANRNQDKEGKYTPEVHVGKKDPVDPLYNDKRVGNFFFGVSPVMDSLGGEIYKAQCHLIFQLNLPKVRPDVMHRADAEAQNDALDALGLALEGDSQITAVVTGIDNVYREYNGWKANTGVIFTDQQPRHVFRINFDLIFINNNC